MDGATSDPPFAPSGQRKGTLTRTQTQALKRTPTGGTGAVAGAADDAGSHTRWPLAGAERVRRPHVARRRAHALTLDSIWGRGGAAQKGRVYDKKEKRKKI